MHVVLFIGHGSRDPEGCEEYRQMVKMMEDRLKGVRMASCFLEFEPPNVQEGIDHCVAMGATEITAIPVMLLDAQHFTRDIPAELALARKRHPHLTIRYGAHLGFHEKLMDVLLECLQEVGEDPFQDNSDAAVLLVGRGSSDPVANANFYKMSRMLWERTAYETVENAFIGLTRPTLEEGLARCFRLGMKRVVVAPYFLFTGRLYKKIRRITLQTAAANPGTVIKITRYFGLHPKVFDVLEQRVEEAVNGRFTAYDHDWMRGLAEGRYGKREGHHHGHHHHHHHHHHAHEDGDHDRRHHAHHHDDYPHHGHSHDDRGPHDLGDLAAEASYAHQAVPGKG